MENKDKYISQKKYQQNKMMQVKVSYKKEFVEEFKMACKKLNLVQSKVIKKAMEEIIEEAKK